jgi:hypothetical protein
VINLLYIKVSMARAHSAGKRRASESILQAPSAKEFIACSFHIYTVAIQHIVNRMYEQKDRSAYLSFSSSFKKSQDLPLLVVVDQRAED